MQASLPISLIIAWCVFLGFLQVHSQHYSKFKGTSQSFLQALSISLFLGVPIGFGLLIYYFVQVAWYWPLVLLFISLIGAIFFGIIEAAIGSLTVSLIGFVGWPAAAVWLFFIIRGLNVQN
jgi:hypothetical protein